MKFDLFFISLHQKSPSALTFFLLNLIIGCLKNLMLKILRGSYPPISNKYSPDLKHLIHCLLEKKPEERPSLNMILRKNFIQKAEYDMHCHKPLERQPTILRVQKQSKKVQNVYNRKNARGRRNSE